MKLYTILIRDQDTGKIIDTYTDVSPTDLQGLNKAMIGAILQWLRRFIV